jgi:hypothetical protein
VGTRISRQILDFCMDQRSRVCQPDFMDLRSDYPDAQRARHIGPVTAMSKAHTELGCL